MLSNPDKRDIYDVYGKEGLAAGLELGERVKNKDDLRKEWEQFRERQVLDWMSGRFGWGNQGGGR